MIKNVFNGVMLGILIERITQKDQELDNDLDYHGVAFPV